MKRAILSAAVLVASALLIGCGDADVGTQVTSTDGDPVQTSGSAPETAGKAPISHPSEKARLGEKPRPRPRRAKDANPRVPRPLRDAHDVVRSKKHFRENPVQRAIQRQLRAVQAMQRSATGADVPDAIERVLRQVGVTP